MTKLHEDATCDSFSLAADAPLKQHDPLHSNRGCKADVQSMAPGGNAQKTL